jgi:hypothetical protein
VRTRRSLVILAGGAIAAAALTAVLVGRGGGSPSWDFDSWKTGVGRVEILNCDGSPLVMGGHPDSGAGFLVGSRVVMTAEHGMWVGLGKAACKMRVRFGAETVAVTSVMAWSAHGEADRRGIDLATLTLERPVKGHVFQIATKSPRRGASVATLGYPLGGPLVVKRGKLAVKLMDYRVPSLATTVQSEGGDSGGPIVDQAGIALGVMSRVVISGSVTKDGHSRYGGIDLAQWWGGKTADDLCRQYPSGIRGCSGDPGERRVRQPVSIKLGG